MIKVNGKGHNLSQPPHNPLTDRHWNFHR